MAESPTNPPAANTDLPYWPPPLRRAVMKTRPEFFSWTQARQERWGLAIPAKDRDRLEEALLSELFGRTFNSHAEALASIDEFSREELNLWNETMLPLYGIGEDCFFLNEPLAKRDSVLEHKTIRDYDESRFRFQEGVCKRDNPDYSGRPYRGSLYLAWARLFVDGQFTYASLSMAAGYAHSWLENIGSDIIEQQIPHDYVPGKNHGKARGDSWEWDMRLDANGDEGILEELQRRLWRYERDRWEALLSEYDDENLCGVYLKDNSVGDEAGLDVVFTDKEALAAVRLRSFLRDCRAIERPCSELDERLESERVPLVAFIEEKHEEIRRNYDPKVSRLAKRNKIVIKNDAFK